MTAIAFAYGAGLLATVNPCGFVMLPAFLAYFIGQPAGSSSPEVADDALFGRLARGFTVGALVSAGFAGVFMTTTLVVSVGLRPVLRYLPMVAVAIGVTLVGLGLTMIGGRRVGMPVRNRSGPSRDISGRAIMAFGAAYALVSLSCTLAILLAVVAQALATSNILGTLGVLVAYGAGSATVLVSLSVSAALANDALTNKMRRLLPLVQRLGGVLLVGSGLYLAAYWWPAPSGGWPAEGARRISQIFSNPLTQLADQNRGVLAGVALALAVTAALVGVARRSRPTTSSKVTGSSR